MAKSKFPWLHLRKKTDPEPPLEPPIWLGNHSNGEYFHIQTKREKKMRQEILKRADDQARYLGMGRREFLTSSMGMAVTLSVFNEACSSEGENAAGGKYGIQGPYVIPPEATCDPSAYIPSTNRFIMDVQTHSFDNGEWRDKQVAYPIFAGILPGSSYCDPTTHPNHLDCFAQDVYAESFFLHSDTTMTVITSWPGAMCLPERQLLGYPTGACGLPLSNDGMRQLRDWINERSLSQRVINQIQVMPNDFLDYQIEGMRAAVEDRTWGCGSWKAYPAYTSDTYPGTDGGARGYFLTDPIGRKFIEEGLKLGVPNFAVHKGLPIPGFDVEHNKPTDIGQVAVDYQMANFVIYHSAINAGTANGPLGAINPTPTENVPYAPTGDVLGVNMLIRDLIDKKLIDDPDSPGTRDPKLKLNVYAEMGAAWLQVMNDATQSQHYIGKLIKYLGPDNIVWGTDALVSGDCQQQIEAFKAFQITDQFVSQYGYRKLTEEDKDKIFGLNAARIYRVDPTAARCQADQNAFAMMKQQLDDEVGGRRWAMRSGHGPKTLREFWENAKRNRAKRVPG